MCPTFIFVFLICENCLKIKYFLLKKMVEARANQKVRHQIMPKSSAPQSCFRRVADIKIRKSGAVCSDCTQSYFQLLYPMLLYRHRRNGVYLTLFPLFRGLKKTFIQSLSKQYQHQEEINETGSASHGR